MGDRTPVQVIVADCPSEQARPVLDIMTEFGLHLEYEEDGVDQDHLLLGRTYLDPEVSTGSATEISQRLQQVAPQASWTVWEDPAYEWLGDLYLFTPRLGPWTAECSAEGDAVFTAEQVLNCLDTADTGVELERMLGRAHSEALVTLTEKNEGVVLPCPTNEEGD